MPRVASSRTPAQPATSEQRARYRRILRAAARFGAESGLERVQMHDVAKASEVAIATLYRYFPSKTHLFTGVMRDQVERMAGRVRGPRPGQDPVEAVTELLLAATRDMLRAPLLAQAMLQANNAALAASVTDVELIDDAFRDLILGSAGIDEPTDRDEQLVRLIKQSWYGILASCLNQRAPLEDAEDDIAVCCRLLLSSWATDA